MTIKDAILDQYNCSMIHSPANTVDNSLFTFNQFSSKPLKELLYILWTGIVEYYV